MSALALTYLFACQKPDDTVTDVTNSTDMLARRGGNGNGRGNGRPNDTTTTPDTLLAYCGITLSDTGSWYPTVTLNNIRWRKQTGYSYDPATGGYTYPYDILVIDFDSITIPNKTVNCYLLLADHCEGRVVCSKGNGLYLSQVTTCNNTNRFWLPIGTSWLNPNVPTYTGVILVGTTDGCLYYSQPFTFEPPRILQI